MRHAVQVRHPDFADVAVLTSLGLRPAQMSAVGIAMLEAGASAHPLGAIQEAGFLRWSRGLGALGDQLVPQGWRRTRRDGLEIIVNKAETTGIAINSGDEHVGDPDHTPAARYQRGGAIARHVRSNELQYDAFPEAVQPINQDEESYGYDLWLLIHHFADNELTLELILPTQLHDDRRGFRLEGRVQIGQFGFADDDDTDAPAGPTITITPR